MKKDQTDDKRNRGWKQNNSQWNIPWGQGKDGKKKIDCNAGKVYKIGNKQFVNYIKIRLTFKFFGQSFKKNV